MRRRLTRLATAVLATTMLTTMLGTALLAAGGSAQAATAFPPTWNNARGGERYVAFGDSFVSGPAIEPQRPGICGRSAHNFPSLVATALKANKFIDASCGGAQTVNYWQPQDSGGGVNPPQLKAVGSHTTLVTLGTMGGNDVGLVGLAQSCIIGDCAGEPGDANFQAIDALAPNFERIIEDVQKRAPHALIVAVGYGTYVPDESCAALQDIFGNPNLDLTAEEATYLQDLIDHLSDTIGEVAAEQGVAFADPRTIPGAADHTACAAPDEQWVRGIVTYGDGAQLHPSTLGMAAIADEVLATIDEAGGTPAQALKAPARTVRFKATCSGAKKQQKVTLRVTGGQGLVSRVAFRIGKRRIAVDTAAPYVATLRTRQVPDTKPYRGRVSARVTVSNDAARLIHTLHAARPGCLR